MKVQAEQIMKNPTRRELTDAMQILIDAACQGSEQDNMDDVYMLAVVRTPSPRQSPLAEAAGLPMIPRG